MADKKTESEQESVQEKPAKATTGAWWKSTVPEKEVKKTVKPVVEESSSPDKKAVAPASPKKRSPRKKPVAQKSSLSDKTEAVLAPPKTRAPRKKPATQKSISTEKKEGDEAGAEADAGVKADGTASPKKVPRKKTPKKAVSRSRGRGKKSDTVTEDVSSVELAGDTPELVTDNAGVVEPVGSVVVASVSGDEPGAEEQKVESSEEKKERNRTPPPRGGRQQKAKEEGKKAVSRSRGRGKKSGTVTENVSSVELAGDTPELVTDSAGVVESVESVAGTSVSGDEPGAEEQKVESSEEKKERNRTPTPRGGRQQKAKEEGTDEQSSQSQKSESVKKEIPPVLKLLINAEEPEECRLALLADGRLESIHVSTVSSKQTKNNIYKARIVAIESSLQAAFVDYGTEKNGFLPFNEIHPEYYKQEISEKNKKLIEQHQWSKLNITEVLERGQEVLVQVVKEEVGNKGANMTTYLSIPGRCVVLMPGSDSTGISRKISGEERRSQLREIITSLGIPEGIGWIVRTASVDITKTALSRDVRYLLNLWKEIKAKGQSLEGVGLVYQDHDCVLRFLREHFDPDIREILVDDLAALEKVNDFLEFLPSKQKGAKARLHKGARPIFNQYNVEDQIESIYQPQVALPSGGSIVIDPTEALVAIDVNSGSTGKGQNFEDSIFKANMEAATELARQLRLRDLGGLIVVDFIDMRSSKNIRGVERQVKNAMKRDRAKVDISRISKFGLMQISRQKLGAPIEAGNYRICEHCKGRGMVRSVETLALFYLRRIQTGASKKEVLRVECRLPLDVAQYLLNNKRNEISELEIRNKISIVIVADPALKPADHEILYHKQEKVIKGRK